MQGIDIYEENANALAIDEFVQEHKALVKKIALHIKRRVPASIELEDLLQSGFVGLLEARKHFKSNMGTSFATFASVRIHGAMIDSLRKNSWGTRESSRNMRIMAEAISKVEQRIQRKASNEEVAAELGVSMDDYALMCQQINISNVLSLDVIDASNSLFGEEDENPQLISQQDDLIQRIKKMLVTLPEREQLVLSLYYIEELTFKQIGEVLDLTEARISQLHSHAIAKLQAKISSEEKSK